MLTVILPAHNESIGIVQAITGLQTQTRKPDRIIVAADNCSDNTADLARSCGVEVYETIDNTHKKAGALNQVLAQTLPTMESDDLVFIQDADSVVYPDFLENAARHIEGSDDIGAVGGTFRATPLESGGLVEKMLWTMQDNEYARYARDVRMLDGRCLVVTGTSAMFRVGTLQEISAARLAGTLPAGDGIGGVYDTSVLTEDNELSFAIMTLGYRLLAPSDCLLFTDSMKTVRELYNQRLRWKRGAVENCVQYGLTKVTRGYWFRQAVTLLGVIITGVYLATLIWAALFGTLHMTVFWMIVTGVFCLERFVTLKDKSLRQRFLSLTMWEMPYEIFLQAVHADAYIRAAFNTKKEW